MSLLFFFWSFSTFPSFLRSNTSFRISVLVLSSEVFVCPFHVAFPSWTSLSIIRKDIFNLPFYNAVYVGKYSSIKHPRFFQLRHEAYNIINRPIIIIWSRVESQHGQEISSSPKLSRMPLVSTQLPGTLSTGIKQPIGQVDHSHLVSRLKTSGAMPLLYVHSWRGQGRALQQQK